MSNREVFRPTSSYVFGFLGFFCVSLLVYVNFLDYGIAGSAIPAIWGILACSICFLIFIRPAVIFFDEGVEIVNPLSRHRIGWQEVEHIETRYTMSVITFDRKGRKGRIHAFAAPAPGRYHSRNIHQSEIRGLNLKEKNIIRAGDSPRTNSGAAAAIARGRFDQFHRFQSASKISYEHQFNFLAVMIIAINLFIGTAGLAFSL